MSDPYEQVCADLDAVSGEAPCPQCGGVMRHRYRISAFVGIGVDAECSRVTCGHLVDVCLIPAMDLADIAAVKVKLAAQWRAAFQPKPTETFY